MWGCDAPSPESGGFVYELGEKKLRRCPNALLSGSWIATLLRLYTAYKQGHTPNGKGLNHETIYYNAAMTQMASAEASADSWLHREMKKNQPTRSK